MTIAKLTVTISVVISSFTPAFAYSPARNRPAAGRFNAVEVAEKPNPRRNHRRHRRQATRLRQGRPNSTPLPRLERTPSGHINDDRFREAVRNRGHRRVRNHHHGPRTRVRGGRPAAQRFAQSPVNQYRNATTRRQPLSRQRNHRTARQHGTGGRHRTHVARNPNTRGTRSAVARRGGAKSPYKNVGKAMGGVAVGGLAVGTIQALQQNEADYKSGRITKAQYQQRQQQQLLNDAAGLAALKKMNVSGLVMNDLIGTDPLSFGAGAIGDLIHGTDNTKRALEGMGEAFDRSLVKQTFTDPKGAAERVGTDVIKTVEGVGKVTLKVGEGVGRAVDGVGKFLFGKKK